MILPTVAVHHPLDPSVRMLINESDLSEEHTLWDPVEADDLRVGKGPRGKWYAYRGQERAFGPFETEIEAMDAATKG